MSAAHYHAERIRARLLGTVQVEREAAGMSRDALEKKCGVSRERSGCIETGDSIPTQRPGEFRQASLCRSSVFGFRVISRSMNAGPACGGGERRIATVAHRARRSAFAAKIY